MAPALTQDSQPELLLPYFSTPPYTPSPPSSVGGTTTNVVSSVLHHHHYHHYHSNNITIRGGCDDASSNTTNDDDQHHSVSCSNMEDGPSGGLDDQHLHRHHQTTLHRRENSINKGGEDVIILEQQEDESRTIRHKAHHHHHHHHHHLDQGDDDNDKFKLEDADEESSLSITFNQPTPPHSTDSSAPLSPLSGARNTHPHSEPSPECVAEEELSFHSSDKSPAHQVSDHNSPPSFLSITAQASGNIFDARSPHHQTEKESNQRILYDAERSSGLYNLTDETTRLPSPHSPLQAPTPVAVNTCDLTTAAATELLGGSVTSTQATVTSTTTSVSVHSSKDLGLCRLTSRSTATLAPTPHLVGSPRSASVVVGEIGEETLEVGELVRPLLGSTTATTSVVSPPATSFSSTVESGSSAAHQVVATMGCTLPQVETKVAVRCSAPQPNDTPPPAAYLPKTNSVILSSSVTDWNNDNLIPVLPDEFFTSLNHLVATHPGLLDQLNPTSSILTVVPPTATSSLLSASAGYTSRVPMLHEAPSLTPASQSIPNPSVVSGGAVFQGLTPEQQASAMVSSLTMRQLRLQKRQAQILRRLRRYTGRGLAAGISQQLRELVKNVPSLVLADKHEPGSASTGEEEEVVAAAMASVSQNHHHTSRDAVPVASPPVVLQPPRYDTTALKSMSTAKLITYVRRMETRSCANSTTGNSSLNSNSCSSSKNNSDCAASQRHQEDDVSSGYLEKQACFPARVRSELGSGACEMSAAARLHVQHDSDATESSSGGESCDEMDGFDDDLHTDSKPIASRALYRHSAERAWIAARWTWLEAQLADVECKIHQHNRAQMRLRHLSRSTASKTELCCHHHHQAASSSPAGSATATSAGGVNPAMFYRPSYTCLTRSTQHHLNNNNASNNTINSLHQSIATHNANTTTTSNGSTFSINTNNSSGSSTTTGSSGVGGCSHPSFLPGAADVSSPTVTTGGLPTLSSCCVDSGSARTSGYRWHRKRRWIRVGNVFERGDACSGGPGSTTQDLKDSLKRIKTSSYTSSTLSTTTANTNNNNNNFIHMNNLTNIKTDNCGGNNFNNNNNNNNNNSIGVDKKVKLLDVVVRQPTFAVSCECVPPYSCVLCTRLPGKGAIVSSALLGDRKSLGTMCSNSKSLSNKLFPLHHPSPLKIKQHSFPAAASSNAAFSPSPRYPHSLSPQQPPLSPLKSLTPSWSVQETAPHAKPPLLLSRQQRAAVSTSTGGRGTESLCKSAWFPRVPSSSRTCLNTQPRYVPLPERLGQHDFAYHPVLSHPSEVLQSTRLESVLKSKAWMKKLSSLQNPSSLLSQRQASSVSSCQQSRLSAHTTIRSSPYKETVPLSGGVGSNNSAAAGATTPTSHYGSAGTEANTRVAPPVSDATDQSGAHHHKSSSSSHSKKKKKNKDRDRSREGRRKDKKKKAYKRKEKEAKKGRLTLRLRKTSVTGEMVPTGEAPCSRDKTHHYLIEGSSNVSGRSSGRGGSGHPIPPPLSLCDGDSSSLYSSSRASSPSLPPHSPAATLSDHGHPHHRGSTAYCAAQLGGDVKGVSSSGGFYGSNINNKYNKSSSHEKTSKTVTYSDKVMRNSGGSTPMDTDGGSGASESSSSFAIAGVATSVSSPAYSTRRTSMFVTSGCGSSGGSSAGAGSGYASSAVAAASQQPITPAAADAMAFKKKQGTASYDIDNIVIPYNMATVTRVEPIEYKEIVTPKWSEMDEPKPLDVRVPVDPTEEDVSEAAVLARHQRSEELERLRFAAHMSTGGTRHGGNARTRQRNAMGSIIATGGTSSAGTNTPENPLSPHVDVAELASPMVSPPSTPQPLSEDSNHSSSPGAPKQLPSFGLSGGNASETAFPEESSVDGNGAVTGKLAAPTLTEATTVSVADALGGQLDAPNTSTAVTAATSASLTTSQTSSTSSPLTATVKTVTHNAPIVISSPFLENFCNNAETATVSTTGDGLIDVADTTIISAPNNVVDVAVEQIISSGSCFPNNDAAAFKAAANNSNGGAASRRLRSNSAGLRPRSGSNGTATNQPSEDEHNSREVSPFPMRQFPLGESQYDSMLRENSEASVHPLPAAAHRTLLHPLDYDHLGETSSEDEDTSDAALLGDGETDEADPGAFQGGVSDSGVATPRSTKRKPSDTGWYVPTPPDSKRKPKRHSSPAFRHTSSSTTNTAVLANHNVKTGASAAVTGNLDHSERNNKIEDALLRLSQHNLSEHSEKMAAAVRRNVPVTISLKDIHSMSLSKSVTDNSEGRCSPLSEATDSAAEDDTTGDLLSSDGGRPDWTISATADSTGHCVMQVLRH